MGRIVEGRLRTSLIAWASAMFFEDADGDKDVALLAFGDVRVGLREAGQHDEQRERHCHQGRYERNLRESHFYPPYGAVVLGLALSPRAGWSVIPLYLRVRRAGSSPMHSMAGMLLSNDSRRPCNRMHGAVLAKPLVMSLRQHATLFLPASRPPVNAEDGVHAQGCTGCTGCTEWRPLQGVGWARRSCAPYLSFRAQPRNLSGDAPSRTNAPLQRQRPPRGRSRPYRRIGRGGTHICTRVRQACQPRRASVVPAKAGTSQPLCAEGAGVVSAPLPPRRGVHVPVHAEGEGTVGRGVRVLRERGRTSSFLRRQEPRSPGAGCPRRSCAGRNPAALLRRARRGLIPSPYKGMRVPPLRAGG